MDVPKTECIDGTMEFLEINGKVGEDSTYLVKKFLEEMDGCRKHRNSSEYFKLVILNSQGGSFINGIRMGELFRKNNVMTALSPGQSCSSACAIAFLGGIMRYMSNESKITFHAPYVKKQLSGFEGQIVNGKFVDYSIDCSDKGQVQVLDDYVSKMIGRENAQHLMKRMMDYCSNEDGWTLNAGAAEAFGITGISK